MDAKYIIGIAEIDAQHESISALVKSLQEVIADESQSKLIHPLLKQLNHLLHVHFAYEESLMKMVNVAELSRHQKMHQGILSLLANYFANPPAPGEYEQLGKLISDRVLGHVMEHDLPMSESIRQHLGRYTTPALNVPENV